MGYKVKLTDAAFAALKKDTKSIVGIVKIERGKGIDPKGERIYTEGDSKSWNQSTESFIRTQKDIAYFNRQEIEVTPASKPVHGANKENLLIHELGIADYVVVDEELCGYEVGEIAHIENVLQGESKIRRHERVDETETEEQKFNEMIQINEHEIDSSSRFEMSDASQQALSQSFSQQFGVNAQFSYGAPLGPTISINTNYGFTDSESKSSTTSSTTSFAKSIIDKARNIVTETVRESRRIKLPIKFRSSINIPSIMQASHLFRVFTIG